MRVAIIHYWLVGMRGGEKVLEALCRLYPQADIFTHVYVPEAVSETIRRHRVKTTFIDRLPRAAIWYKRYLPLMPLALEQLDLRGYDLVISSESGPAKGVIPASDAAHVCYCHSPMRYLWNMSHDYRDRSGAITRALMPSLSHYLRIWDVSTVARVDDFVANSHSVAARIQRYYHRPATVIAPPVDTAAFAPAPANELANYHLMVGELVAYKRPDLAVEAFNRSGRRLVVIGGGEMLGALRAMAGPNVEIIGPQPFPVLQHHYARCRALIFPGEEDFGIVPVEAMASGRPVVAYGRGGATETVMPGVSGVLFDTQDVEAINAAVDEADRTAFEPARLVAHARRFGSDRFARDMADHVEGVLDAHASRRRAPALRQPAGARIRDYATRLRDPSGLTPVPRHAAE
ncbi:glycosyltransferase [Methylobacterium trifolii]|uniref:D-inositol-3-phosphate glycosyltransferase n=1 Tax=Methylobacterium trifolii TaxID=1003092 RepID=A0ABQ4U5J7_9HYPH|nr:glycosyltransferase [Methylobacterium trifolii]GJE62695.1 D-inositol-3-phosphate glycosyltransferase [Methylobacterium trifolii]